MADEFKNIMDVNIREILNKPYLTEKEVSRITQRALPTLRGDRFNRRGIPYYRVAGRSIRYKAEDVVAFMEGCRISFDGETP